MDNDQISLMGAEEIEKDQLDGFTAKEQELIHQLVQRNPDSPPNTLSKMVSMPHRKISLPMPLLAET